MKFFALIRRESSLPLRRLMIIGAIAGLSNALVLAIINSGVERIAHGAVGFWHLALFLVTMAIYNVSQRYVLGETTAEIENILHRIRVKLADKVRHCDLMPLEKIGRSLIYASVSRETQTISQVSGLIVVGYQAALLIMFSMLYLASLSLTAFFLFVVSIAIAISLHFKRMRNYNQELHRSMAEENKLFESFTDLLDGFKEVKLNPKRSDELFENLQQTSRTATGFRVKTQLWISEQFIFSQTTFYALVAAMVFIVPRLSGSYSEVVAKTTTTVLFLIGPITNLVSAIPVFATANAATENIDALEKRLDKSIYRPSTSDPLSSFEEIRFQGVTFRYKDPDSSWFTVGPLDLVIRRGEMIFVAGGNGSGKTSFLKLLTALYYPEAGTIRVDGRPVTESDYEAYRQLFSVIFSDYHLFRRLYGLIADGATVDALLEDLELTGKTRFVDGEFQTLELSTGQRKRLALLVSLLEDRPIYIFDEWAAEQDPEFRRRFYEELLPELKARGKTIIAVTHDDRYYPIADRILKMEEGRLLSS